MDTWTVKEDILWTPVGITRGYKVLPDIKQIRSQETVFTVGNGYFCTRGTFEEGYPDATPATLLYGVFDDLPIAKTELANAPDWTPIKLFINGERFRLDRGTILDYQRELHLHKGALKRSVLWQSISGIRLRVTAERFASLADEHFAAQRYSLTIEKAPGPVDLILRASIEGGQGNNNRMHWETLDQGHKGDLIWLCSTTKTSRIELAQIMTLDLVTPDLTQCLQKELIDSDLNPSIELSGLLEPGETLIAEKCMTMYTSRDEVTDLVPEALTHLKRQREGVGPTTSLYEKKYAMSRAAWEEYWSMADVILEGDEKAQLGLRYSLYQLRINVRKHDSRYSIGAKGLTGFGYHGHVFHDTEVFMLPFFTYVLPDIARNLLLYRYNGLPAARAKAASHGYLGAQFPWESALGGQEVTPPAIIHPETNEIIAVPNGAFELHITASIAHATWEYVCITGDYNFLHDYGAELLLSTAQFWVSRVARDEKSGDYVITNVIGPDEWHENVDNNAFTNAMVRHNISIALKAWKWLHTNAHHKAHSLQHQLGLDDQQLAHWRGVIKNLRIPYDPQTSLIEQFEGFFKLLPLDQSRYAGRKQSYEGLLGIEGVQDYQIIKQADVLMFLILLSQEFDLPVKEVNWDYYYPITDHDYGSSLTPAEHVILAGELGKREEAYRLFLKGALVDLENLRGNTPDGIHMAAAGAVWQAAVLGVAGLRLTGQGYTTSPLWLNDWKRLAFHFCYEGKRVHVDLRR